MPSSERRRQYRTALVTARNVGLSDAELAEIIEALGPNAPLDDLEAALWQYVPVLNPREMVA